MELTHLGIEVSNLLFQNINHYEYKYIYNDSAFYIEFLFYRYQIVSILPIKFCSEHNFNNFYSLLKLLYKFKWNVGKYNKVLCFWCFFISIKYRFLLYFEVLVFFYWLNFYFVMHLCEFSFYFFKFDTLCLPKNSRGKLASKNCIILQITWL